MITSYTNICPIILAAGRGSRMTHSNYPKSLQLVGGRTIIDRLIDGLTDSALKAKPLVVVGSQAQYFKQHLGDRVEYAHQNKPQGTGDAVNCAIPHLTDYYDHIMVINGDHPFLSPAVINGLVNTHLINQASVTLTTLQTETYTGPQAHLFNYGRIIRNNQGTVAKIVELKDATPAEKAIKEVNVGYYCFALPWLVKNINNLTCDNAQNEYYLTDMVDLAVRDQQRISSFAVDTASSVGINTPEQLQQAEAMLKFKHDRKL